jgi:hypothetical protein
MKKLRTIFVAVAVLAVTGSFAANGPEKVSARVRAQFEKNFTTAVNVTWEQNNDFYFASFELNEKAVSAAYNAEGELLGMSRVVPIAELPLPVSLSVGSKYQGYDLAKSATEITYEGQTSYYVSVENSKQILKLKCAANGDISIDKKTKK